MELTHRQQKYIRKNIHNLNAEQLAARLHVPEADVVDYIKERWGEEKVTQKKEKSSVVRNDFGIKVNWAFILSSCFLLLVLVLVAYLNILGNEFVSDDIATIVEDPNIAKASYFLSRPIIFVQPLLYYITIHIFGKNPLGFHILNILFHYANVVLVFGIFLLMEGPLFALLGASLFAVHPILTEAVTWISGNSYVLYTFFFLASFLSYLWAKRQDTTRQSLKWYILAFVLFVLSLFTASKSGVLAFAFVAYEFATGNLKKTWKVLTPFVVAAGGFIIFYGLGIGQRITSLRTDYYQKTQIYNPFVQIPIAVVSYLQLMVWPDALAFYHSELAYSRSQFAVIVIFFVMFLGSIFLAYKKNRLIFFWLCFFIISLLTTFTPFGISWVVAERYVYTGTIGIIFAVTYFFYKYMINKKYQSVTAFIFVIIVMALTVRTVIRNFDWKNADSLWIATSRTSPSDPKTHNNMGDYYGRHNDYKRAIEEFQTAIRMNPNYADSYHNVANIYFRTGKIDAAIANYNKALEINPKLWESHQSLAGVYYDQKNYAKSEDEMKKAIAISPQPRADLYAGLGLIYYADNKMPEAKEAFTKAHELDPTNPQAIQGLKVLGK